MSLLRIAGLNLEIHGTPILRDVAMKVHGGEILGVIGESGSGKSMTALASPAGSSSTAPISSPNPSQRCAASAAATSAWSFRSR